MEMYNGRLFKDIRCHLGSADVSDHINLIVMSAEHGFLSANTSVSKYDTQMGVDVTPAEWVKKHTRNCAMSLGISTIHEEDRAGGLFVFLPSAYQQAFEMMLKKSIFKGVVKDFKQFYMCKDFRGIGVMRSRLIKLLKHKASPVAELMHFRSGISAVGEFEGAVQAGQFRGMSLANVNLKSAEDKPECDWLMNRMKLDLFADKPFFFDNGIINAIKKGQDIDAGAVLREVEQISKTFAPGSGHNFYFVLPDDPFNQIAAVDVLRENRDIIQRLSKSVSLIMPIHKITTGNLQQHALDMLEAIDFAPVILGIPTRCDAKLPNGKSVNLRMDIKDIETLFELKDTQNQPVFTRVHFLGMSEASKGGFIRTNNGCYQERVAIANLHQKEFSSDVCVMQSFFGANKSARAGSVHVRSLDAELSKFAIENSALIDYLRTTGSTKVLYSILDSLECTLNPIIIDKHISYWNEITDPRYHVKGSTGFTVPYNELLQTVHKHIDIDKYLVADYLIQLYKEELVTVYELPSYDELRALALVKVFSDESNYYTSNSPHLFSEIVEVEDFRGMQCSKVPRNRNAVTISTEEEVVLEVEEASTIDTLDILTFLKSAINDHVTIQPEAIQVESFVEPELKVTFIGDIIYELKAAVIGAGIFTDTNSDTAVFGCEPDEGAGIIEQLQSAVLIRGPLTELVTAFEKEEVLT